MSLKVCHGQVRQTAREIQVKAIKELELEARSSKVDRCKKLSTREVFYKSFQETLNDACNPEICKEKGVSKEIFDEIRFVCCSETMTKHMSN